MAEQMTSGKPTVQVAYADATGQYLVSVDWQPQLTAMQALEQSGLLTRLAAGQELSIGIFGHKIDDPAQYLMQAGERLEIYRPLIRDPRDVRRKRAEAHPVGRFKRKI